MHDELPGYRLLRLIGRGGSSEVWQARAVGSDGPDVAVLRLVSGCTDGAVAARWAEAALLAELDHPNLLPLLAVVDDPPGSALVVPLLLGGTVRDLLDRRGALPAGEVVALLGPVAGAVEVLHRHGVVHGDLKPENLLLTAEGVPVVGDLGSARRIGDAASPVSATPAYLDPHAVASGPGGLGRVRGPRASASASADVYALGVIAYEALTGRLPHRGDPNEALALAAAGAHRALASWPGVPAAVAAAVERAIDPDPSRRPTGAVAFVAELRAAVPSAEVVLPAPPPASPLAVRDPAEGATLEVSWSVRPDVTADPVGRSRAARIASVAAATGVAIASVGAATVLTLLSSR